jgi:WD40 repeat protein
VSLSNAPHAIQIKVDEVSQLFNTLDPFPFRERDLDKNAEDFIFSSDEERVFYQVGNTLTAMKLATREILFAVKPATNVTHMDLSPDGSRLAMKNTSGRTLIVDASSGATLADFKNQREGEGDGVRFSPCGKFVVTISWNGLLNVRDSQAGKVVFEDFQQGCMLTNLSIPKDRRFIIYSLAEPLDESAGRRTRHKLILRNWPLSDGNIREIFSEYHTTNCCAISPSGRFFAAAHFKEFAVTDLKTSKVIGHLPIGTYIRKMAWTHDERFIGLSDADAYHVLEVPSLKVKHKFSMQYANSITFSPSTKYIAVKGHIVPMDYLDTFIQSIKPSA